MKTKQAISLAGNAAALARLLGITQSAITQWGEDLPDKRVWQLRVLKPGWFQAGECQRADTEAEQL